MSIRVMTQVWANSRQKGNALLMLLAIADFADDQGYAHPGIETLAEKSRMSERNTRYVLATLVASGELELSRGTGPRGCNEYQIKLSQNLELFAPRGATASGEAKISGGARARTQGVQKQPQRGATAIAPEPLTVIKPSVVAQAASQPVDNPLSGQKATTEAWNAYCEMMFGTYQVEPPRNAKSMGQLSNLIGRVGRDDAVALIRFYFTQKNNFYSTVKHSLDVLLKDSNKLLITMKQVERAARQAA
jgi:hypothetical protein